MFLLTDMPGETTTETVPAMELQQSQAETG